MRAPTTSKDPPTATPTRTVRGYLGHKRPTWERADLAARAYVQRRPITAPTLQQLALAYRVSIASIKRQLNGKKPKPTLADMLASASPSERAEAAARLGPGVVWDTMISPLLDQERASQEAAE
jgi:hypothetical protein